VTDADREKALAVVFPLTRYRLPRDDEWTTEHRATVARVAQALADEREKARAPFLALAEELEGRNERKPLLRQPKYVAVLIRRAAEAQQ
jgi:hypothetical protein